ncbi:hypothetical protein LJB42_003724 [Komagataella kurtzmanii]|nr:hypothetical protein LJB42_003724 [Komagataella kurtzmanii]
MPINQPMSQIKLTNVSLVRMRKNKKRFEIACYQNKIQDWRSGAEKDIDEVLQIPQVFVNVSKGQVAPHDDLKKCFGTTDTDTIIKEILNKGEIQLSEKERQANSSKYTAEVLQLVSAKCINPKTMKRYPTTMIHKALNELKFNLASTKPAKSHALDAIRLLVSKQLIPIARAKMKVKIVMNSKDAKSNKDKLHSLITEIESENWSSEWEAFAYIDPSNYRELFNMAKVELLEMAAINESSGTL